ncbi:MAG: glutamate synthase subunit beta [Bacteroidota bacterium]
MSRIRGFMQADRELPQKRPVAERLRDYNAIDKPYDAETLRTQANRCMDCGVPFCTSGCPLGNVIPDWNNLVAREDWKAAYHRLRATNNFPEFTGRICPAPCESACVLGLYSDPVTIEQIEQTIIEQAFDNGWVQPIIPARRTGKRVAIIGSGPAGLACADQLNQAGHTVTIYERDDRAGGLLRYGIPDFKLEKWIIERRLSILRREGIRFELGVEVGVDVPIDQLEREHDAVVICVGSTKPRDLPIPGRELSGIHFAWDFLWQQNKRVAGDDLRAAGIPELTATGKHVIVIGSGDTGSDCVGTSNRQGAASVTQFGIGQRPFDHRTERDPWPYYPMTLRTSTSHEEGGDREWQVLTKRFIGERGVLKAVETIRVVRGVDDEGRLTITEIEGTEQRFPADLVLLAIGYTGPEASHFVGQMGLELDRRGNIVTDPNTYETSRPGVFAAGDARRGQSLVVWAISEGREAARAIDMQLSGFISLPTKGVGDLPMRA